MNYYAYLALDLLVLSLPLLAQFHPKLRSQRFWSGFLFSFSSVGGIFIVWDIVKTALGVWGFSQFYTLGIQIGNLPLEEVLFFFCIPFACLTILRALEVAFPRWETELSLSTRRPAVVLVPNRFAQLAPLLLATLFTSASIIALDRTYTAVVWLSCAVILILVNLWDPGLWRNRFYWAYLGLSYLGFLAVNTILTAAPIVYYDNSRNLGVRIGTIPLEDFFYNFVLLTSFLLAVRFWNGKDRALPTPVSKIRQLLGFS